jgi:hypothetical protein
MDGSGHHLAAVTLIPRAPGLSAQQQAELWADRWVELRELRGQISHDERWPEQTIRFTVWPRAQNLNLESTLTSQRQVMADFADSLQLQRTPPAMVNQIMQEQAHRANHSQPPAYSHIDALSDHHHAMMAGDPHGPAAAEAERQLHAALRLEANNGHPPPMQRSSSATSLYGTLGDSILHELHAKGAVPTAPANLPPAAQLLQGPNSARPRVMAVSAPKVPQGGPPANRGGAYEPRSDLLARAPARGAHPATASAPAPSRSSGGGNHAWAEELHFDLMSHNHADAHTPANPPARSNNGKIYA